MQHAYHSLDESAAVDSGATPHPVWVINYSTLKIRVVKDDTEVGAMLAEKYPHAPSKAGEGAAVSTCCFFNLHFL